MCALGIGSFAESPVVPEAAAVRIDPTFPSDLAALIGCAVVTDVVCAVDDAFDAMRAGELARSLIVFGR